MRLTLKLAAVVLISVGLTLLINVILRVQRERHLLENDIRKDHVILGRALAIDLVEEWGAMGRDAALALAAKMNAERAGIDIAAFPVEKVPPGIVPTLEHGEVVQTFEGDGDDANLVTWVPLARRSGLVAALSLTESLKPSHDYIESTIQRTAVSAFVGLVIATTLAFVFGFVLVGRPVRRLVEKARRVGSGDLTGPLPEGPHDELGLLARELNAMCDRLVDAREDLERLNAERLKAEQQLRHADRLSTLGMLSAGIAHELGTPLNIVAGRARLIADSHGDDESTLKSARAIEEQAQRMTRIVRQLLDFARARRPAKAPSDLGKLARETVDMLTPLAQRRGVDLTVEAAPTPEVLVDGAQLQQAMTNLLVNAVQASAAGKTVRVRVRDAGPGVDIDVVDEGEGMEPEQLEKIFTPFYTTKDVGEGTGLGLAVAWGLVQENGGNIRVQSEPAHGSTFTIHLPREAT